MKKRYKFVRIPYEAWEGFYKKKNILEKIAQQELRKSEKVSFADTLRYFSQKPIFVYNDDFVNFFRKRKGKNNRVNIL